MGKAMDGGGLGLGGDFGGNVCTPAPTPDVRRCRKSRLQEPSGGFLLLGCWGPSMGDHLLLQLVRRRRDPRCRDAGRGQPAAAGTERSRFLPCPLFPRARLGIPFPAKLRHKPDHSWHLADPSSVPAACRNSHLPARLASFSVYPPSHLNARDARKQRGKVQAGCLRLAPLPQTPRAPPTPRRCFNPRGCS